ncbi:MAG: TolC family protein [Planctomycetes bacterium]|nr:TolC family protein [Planctomycetota bacterium]
MDRRQLFLIVLLAFASVTPAYAQSVRTRDSAVSGGQKPKSPRIPSANRAAKTVVRGAEPDAEPGVREISGTQNSDTERPKFDLETLSRLAVENHPVLRRDQARIESAAGQALQKGLYPNLMFNANNPQVFAGRNTLLRPGVQMDLVVKGKLRLDRAAALKAQQQSENVLIQDKFELLAAVRRQFYVVLAAQTRVEVWKRLLAVTEASVETGRERFKAKVSDEQEVLLLQIDDNKVRASLANATQMLAGQRRQLAALVGYPGLIDDNLTGSLGAKPPLFDEAFLERFVTTENAQIQIALLDIDKQKILLKRAQVEPYPNLTIGPAYQFDLTRGNEQYWFNVIFTIPVSDRNQGNIESARANVRDSMETLGQVQLDLLRKLADAFSAHQGAVKQAQQFRTQILPESRESLRLAKSGYDVGDLSFSVYLQSQRTLIEAAQDYVDALEKVWTTASIVSGLLQMEQFP